MHNKFYAKRKKKNSKDKYFGSMYKCYFCFGMMMKGNPIVAWRFLKRMRVCNYASVVKFMDVPVKYTIGGKCKHNYQKKSGKYM